MGKGKIYSVAAIIIVILGALSSLTACSGSNNADDDRIQQVGNMIFEKQDNGDYIIYHSNDTASNSTNNSNSSSVNNQNTYQADDSNVVNNITWYVSDDMKTLYINGTGKVSIDTCDYGWKNYDDYIEKLVVGEGITSIEGGYSSIGMWVPIVGHYNSKVTVKEVILPSTLKRIDKCCFALFDIESIIIPDSVTYIGDNVFRECNNLREIKLPKNLKEIGNYAFEDCHKLRCIVIPEGVTNVGDMIYAGGLNELVATYIPSTIQRIGIIPGKNVYYNGSLKQWIGLGKEDKSYMHYDVNLVQFNNIWNRIKIYGTYKIVEFYISFCGEDNLVPIIDDSITTNSDFSFTSYSSGYFEILEIDENEVSWNSIGDTIEYLTYDSQNFYDKEDNESCPYEYDDKDGKIRMTNTFYAENRGEDVTIKYVFERMNKVQRENYVKYFDRGWYSEDKRYYLDYFFEYLGKIMERIEGNDAGNEYYDYGENFSGYTETWEEEEDYYEGDPIDEDMIIPSSSSRYLTYSDVNYLSKQELRLARNEIYARHGRIFDSDDLKNYFNNCFWYEPEYYSWEFDDNWLSDIERANINFLKEVEDSR